MIGTRRWSLALAAVAALVAAIAYHQATGTVDVVVAARDVEIPRALSHEDLAVRAVAAALAPADAMRRMEDVVGLVPRTPLLAGQVVLGRSVRSDAAELRIGMPIARDQRAIAIPVTAATAVGGAVVPGSRVDVVAVPVLGRAPAGRATELIAASAVVLDVRDEDGAPLLGLPSRSGGVVTERIASVVIAVAHDDAVRIADRVATSTFVLALASAR